VVVRSPRRLALEELRAGPPPLRAGDRVVRRHRRRRPRPQSRAQRILGVEAVSDVERAPATRPRARRRAWAWTIEPDLTPIFLGAGYGAGAYFFLRTFLSQQFHPSAAGIFGAGFFAMFMLVATLIHWDRFNHGDAPLARIVQESA
jgi:hypothetical protein